MSLQAKDVLAEGAECRAVLEVHRLRCVNEQLPQLLQATNQSLLKMAGCDLSRPVSIYVYYSTEGVSPRYFQAAPRLPEAAFDAKQPVRSYTLLSLTVFECCNAVYNYIHYRTNYTAPVDHL